MVAALTFEQAGVRFSDGTDAVDDVSFAVAAGEMVGLVGPSGCGKTTLLRVAAGLVRPTAGAVTRTPREVGFVFQDPTLLPWRTVQRNVELAPELKGAAAADRRRQSAAAIALVGLGGFERHYPRALSGGMRMRVSLARALTMRPELFLLDEPFGAVDELTRERLQDELLRLHDHEGFAGLFVTHSVTEAVYLSARVIVLTPRPARVAAEVAVPFDGARRAELRYDAAFVKVAGQVSEALRAAAPAS